MSIPASGGSNIALNVKLEEVEGIVSYFDEEHNDGKPKDVGDGKVYKEYLMTLTAEVKRKNISWLDKVKDEEADFLVILGKISDMALSYIVQTTPLQL